MMAEGVILLLGASALLLAVLLTGAAVHIATDSSPRVFLWPRLRHPDERHYAARLATVPWCLLLYLATVNALAVLIFSQDLQGDPTAGPAFGLLATLPCALMVHLLDYRHSRAAAVLTLLLVAGLAAAFTYQHRSWLPVAFATPLLLWSLNGVRATFADRTPG